MKIFKKLVAPVTIINIDKLEAFRKKKIHFKRPIIPTIIQEYIGFKTFLIILIFSCSLYDRAFIY